MLHTLPAVTGWRRVSGWPTALPPRAILNRLLVVMLTTFVLAAWAATAAAFAAVANRAVTTADR